MNIALSRTVPARKRCQSFGARQLPWCHARLVDMPAPSFEIEGSMAPVGLFGAMSPDGMLHASEAIAREWAIARSVLAAR